MPRLGKTAYRLGQPCPHCTKQRKFGRLAPVPLPEEIRAGSGSHPRVDFLKCTRCGRAYRSEDRGKDLNELREAALKGFKNPRKKPTKCLRCRVGTVRGDNGSLSSMRPRPPCTEYDYCPVCNTILWVVVPPTEAQRLTRLRWSDGKFMPRAQIAEGPEAHAGLEDVLKRFRSPTAGTADDLVAPIPGPRRRRPR